MILNRRNGFTLVEVVVVVPIALLAIAGLVAFLITLYTEVLKDTAVNRLAHEAQTALLTIKDDAYTAYSFAEVSNPNIVDPNAPAGGWKYDTAPLPLIIEEVALNNPKEAVNAKIIYYRNPNGCQGAGVLQNPPVINNLIYYVDSNQNLRRRVLVPDPYQQYCKTPYRQQTCPTDSIRSEQQEDGSFEDVACPADAILATGVTSLSKLYYDSFGKPIILVGDTSPLEAEKVKLTLTLQRIVNGNAVSYTASLTVGKNNGGDGVPDDPPPNNN